MPPWRTTSALQEEQLLSFHAQNLATGWDRAGLVLLPHMQSSNGWVEITSAKCTWPGTK